MKVRDEEDVLGPEELAEDDLVACVARSRDIFDRRSVTKVEDGIIEEGSTISLGSRNESP